jgi:hypothetical protein
MTKHRRLLERKLKGPPAVDFDDSNRQGFAANTGLLESASAVAESVDYTDWI